MTESLVVRKIDRAPAQIVSELGAAGVATVHEAAGQIGLLDPGITPIQQGVSVGGSAVTVSCAADDNMMIHAAVEVVEPGDILVVGTTSTSNHGMFGDLLATSLMTRGCRGLVIDAGVRDTSDLRAMGFPVWSRVVHAQGTVKETPGSVNVPIRCGGMIVNPGDVVVADDDGVVVIPRHRAREVLEATRDRLAGEETTRARLEEGELGVDFYGLRDKLTDLGTRWVDRAEEG